MRNIGSWTGQRGIRNYYYIDIVHDTGRNAGTEALCNVSSGGELDARASQLNYRVHTLLG